MRRKGEGIAKGDSRSTFNMPITRSAAKQGRIDDPPSTKTSPEAKGKSAAKGQKGSEKQDGKAKHSPGADEKPIKRTSRAAHVRSGPPKKRQKQAVVTSPREQHVASNDEAALEKPIMINRSPVLQLWGACVADFLYPNLPWTACLSIGSAISSLCAVSKGRAIGLIEPREEDEERAAERKERRKKAEEGAERIHVMGFPLPLKGESVLVSGTPHRLNEDNLKAKFGGEEQYGRVKMAMTEALKSWDDDKDDLNKKAFHMYETFRPHVAYGKQGWGKKGELNLPQVSSAIQR